MTLHMTGGEAVVRALAALGVEHVFGIVSVHNIPIYDAIERLGGITPVAVRHEQGAVHMADGYARATGRLGVAITSTGPGAANAMNGLFEAAFASSRVLMLTGQIESRFYGKGKGFLHEAERQLDMLRSVCRRVESVRRTEQIAETVVRTGLDVCTGRPQPGAVEIPIDLQYAAADVDVPANVGQWPRLVPPQASIEQAASALRGARRPLIWAGGGVVTADASEPLVRLAETLNAPVVTTLNGRGCIPDGHPLCVGANAAAARGVVEEADVVLAVGTRFQAGDTGQWTIPIAGTLVHLDADPGVVGRSYVPQVPIVGDAKLGLEAIAALVDSSAADHAFLERARAARDAAQTGARQMIGRDHEAIMDAIRETLPDDGIVVRDATVPAYLWGDRLLPIRAPRTSMRPTSAAIGPGLPLAIGASIATGRRSVLIAGDGGFMLNVAEIATAVQYAVPVVMCVFNDGGYGVLRAIQARQFEGRTAGVDLHTPDFAAVARAMGAGGERVAGVDAFRDAFKRAVDTDGPVLLDVDMDALQPMAAFGRPRPS